MKTYTHYLFASFSLSLAITITRIFSKTDSLGMLEHVYYLIATGIFVGSFAFIGKLVRDFLMPDSILTTSAVDTFKQKVFWMIGPQVVCGVLGLIATHGLHKTLFLDKAMKAPAYQVQQHQPESDASENAETDPSTYAIEKN